MPVEKSNSRLYDRLSPERRLRIAAMSGRKIGGGRDVNLATVFVGRNAKRHDGRAEMIDQR